MILCIWNRLRLRLNQGDFPALSPNTGPHLKDTNPISQWRCQAKGSLL
ncbi:mCG1051002 [Mus musculus]|nr:mCG1051002 [Mus musculus]